MKKLIAILVLTAAFVALCYYVPGAVEASVPNVSVISAQVCRYSKTVTATGEALYEDEFKVKSAVPVVVKSYCVKAGDEVKQGDKIADIDVEATKAAVAEMRSDETFKAVFAAAGGDSLLEASIPDAVYTEQSGTVTSLDSQTGELALQEAAIATISDSEDIYVKLAVNEGDAPKISEGQTAFISGKALSKRYTATVDTVFPTARKRYSGTSAETVVDVLLKLDNPDSEIKSGYSVTGQVIVEDEKEALVLPYSAIMQDDSGEYVYVLEGNTAVRKDIETGHELDMGAEILSGISEESLVIENPESTENGGYVTVK